LIGESLHQSFFYSFITILPSESGVTLDYRKENTKCVGKKRFNGSVTHGLRKEYVLRPPSHFGQGKIINAKSEIPLPSDGFLFDLLEPWDVRALFIRKTADLPLHTYWLATERY
jgi:hypothetical protein